MSTDVANDLLGDLREKMDSQSKVTKKQLIIQKLKLWPQSLRSQNVSRVFETKHKSVKFLWITFICISFSYCLLNLYRLVKVYLNFDYVTHSEVITEVPTLFPTITICNINALSTIYAENLVKEMFKMEFNLDIEKSNLTAKEFLYKLETANKLAHFHSYVSESYDDNKRKNLGFSLDETLLSCKYNDYPCGENDFVWFYSIEYGNCYSFNSGFDFDRKRVELKMSTRSGMLNGLRLKFFLNVLRNKYSSTFEKGLKIFIHNNSLAPMSTEGINIKQRANTDIVLKKNFFFRQPEPYSDCKDLNFLEIENDLLNYFKNSNYAYRQNDCFDLCLQYDIIKQCDCYSLEYPRLFNAKNSCLNKTQLTCYNKLYAKFIKGNVKEKCSFMCPLECNSMTYDHSMSISEISPKQFYDIVINDTYYKEKYFKNETNLTLDSFEERYLSLNIYYSELKYLVMTQSIKMTFEDLLSSIGGLLGLLVGMSFLSLIEIIELFIEILLIIFQK